MVWLSFLSLLMLAIQFWCLLDSTCFWTLLFLTAGVSWHALCIAAGSWHTWDADLDQFPDSVINRGLLIDFCIRLDLYLPLFSTTLRFRETKRPFQASKALHHFQSQPELDLSDVVLHRILPCQKKATCSPPFWASCTIFGLDMTCICLCSRLLYAFGRCESRFRLRKLRTIFTCSLDWISLMLFFIKFFIVRRKRLLCAILS